MNADEVLLIRDIRRMFDKVPIDTARVEITVTRGHVSLTGTFRPLRSHPFVDIREQVDELERRLRKDPRIRLLTMECRVVKQVHHEKQHFGEHDEEAGGEPTPKPVRKDPNSWDSWTEE